MKAGHILLATAVGIGVLAGGCAVIGLWKTTTPESVSSPPKESPPTETPPDEAPPKEAPPQEAAREAPIAFNRQDPKVIAYMAGLKRAIDQKWVYPSAALREGREGRLTLELTVLKNGLLETVRVVRSSGSSVLDEEAIRAVKAAAPFKPLPAEMGRERLTIRTSFDYSDKRPK